MPSLLKISSSPTHSLVDESVHSSVSVSNLQMSSLLIRVSERKLADLLASLCQKLTANILVEVNIKYLIRKRDWLYRVCSQRKILCSWQSIAIQVSHCLCYLWTQVSLHECQHKLLGKWHNQRQYWLWQLQATMYNISTFYCTPSWH